jgi:hypothetical protein
MRSSLLWGLVGHNGRRADVERGDVVAPIRAAIGEGDRTIVAIGRLALMDHRRMAEFTHLL